MKTEVRPLTGLRGVAAVWVTLYHIHWKQVSAGTTPEILRHGYLAVDIFFVLSGFVMMMTYSRPGHGDWTVGKCIDFFVRRVGRVWPAYALVTLCLSALLLARVLKAPAPSLREILVNLTLTESWWRIRPIDEPAWSVSAELAAYLIFPIAAVILTRGRAAVSGMIGICLLLLDLSLPHLQTYFAGRVIDGNGPFDMSSRETLIPVGRCLIEFALGAALYNATPARFISIAKRDWFCLLLFALTLIALCVHNSDYVFIVIVPAIVITTVASGRIVTLLFSNVWIYSLGCWSYSLYLIHFHSNAIQTVAYKALSRLPSQLASPMSYVVQYALLIVVSAVLYRWCEKPSLRVFRGFAGRIEAAFGIERLPPEAEKGAV